MEIKIIHAHSFEGFNKVADMLQDGWNLIQAINNGNPKSDMARGGLIYHLVKITQKELEDIQKDKDAAEKGEQIVSIKSVKHNEVDDYLQKGYHVTSDKIFSGHVIVIKYQRDLAEFPLETPEEKEKKKFLQPDA